MDCGAGSETEPSRPIVLRLNGIKRVYNLRRTTRTDVRINLQEGSLSGGVSDAVTVFDLLLCLAEMQEESRVGEKWGNSLGPSLSVLHLLTSGSRRKRTAQLLGSRENFNEFQGWILEPSGFAASLYWLNVPFHALEL